MAGWPRGSSEQSLLKKLSAEFPPSETENGYYTRSWAKQARELDSSGLVGQMAIIGSMSHASCDGQDSDDPSRRVILEGEKLLLFFSDFRYRPASLVIGCKRPLGVVPRGRSKADATDWLRRNRRKPSPRPQESFLANRGFCL
jgi:hypothetical protein